MPLVGLALFVTWIVLVAGVRSYIQHRRTGTGKPRRIDMAKTHRGSSRRRSKSSDEQAAGGSGGFLGQVGLFETANGLPHGPAAVALAIVAAILIYPITRVVGMLRRR